MLTVALRKVATGEIRLVRDEYSDGWEGENGGEWIWTGGNYGCDCNRALFFARAGDEEEPDDPDCGATAYRIAYVVVDGKQFEVEDV